MRVHEILRIISKRHKPEKEVFLTEVKSGPTWNNPMLRRFDAVAIKRSWTNPSITIYEVKLTHQDFLRDMKWPDYLRYCHRFYFACPSRIISPDEIDPTVGLIWVNPDNHALKVKKQAVFRDIEMPHQIFYHLVISHMNIDRHPFFGDTREYLEAWVEDRKNKNTLAVAVKSKMWSRMLKAEEKSREYERQMRSMEGELQEYNAIKQILVEHGVRTGWSIKNNLIDRLNCNLSDRLRNELVFLRGMIDIVLNNKGGGL